MTDAAPTFDLQSHSTHSDGSLPPAEVVRRAAASGVELLALTDHDSVNGVEEALATAAELGTIRVVPAAELSALDGDHEDLHILGYGLDHRDARLARALAEFREDRARRAHRMADALRELGLELAGAPLVVREAKGKAIGRPHLAQAVVDHPGNRARLEAERLADASQVLEAYLVPGAPAYRRRTTPTVSEAIGLIHAAGGVAVWAHPFWDLDHDDDVRDTIARFKTEGIDGVEAFYVTHTRAQTLLVAGACDEHDLLMTGSADFHGPDHPRFDRFRAFSTHGRKPRLGPIA